MSDEPEQLPNPTDPAESIPEAGPQPEPAFGEPSREPPAVVDAPERSREF